MVARFPQSKHPKETSWKHSPSIILLVRCKSQAGPIQGRWVELHNLMAEWHSHIIKDHVKWAIASCPSLENILATLRSDNTHIRKEKEVLWERWKASPVSNIYMPLCQDPIFLFQLFRTFCPCFLCPPCISDEQVFWMTVWCLLHTLRLQEVERHIQLEGFASCPTPAHS